jgi:hypothetical protein
MASTFQSSKKCPGCGKWSDWNKEITDTCQHCGVLLSDRTSFSAAAREAEQQKQKPFDIGIVTIHPHDSWPVFFTFLYFSIYFEGLLPALAARYTRDWKDVVAYAAGGLIFYYCCNPHRSLKVVQDKKYIVGSTH